jgi:subtilase family serine protease
MLPNRPGKGLIITLLCLSSAVAIASAIAAPPSSERTTLKGSAPSWATAKNLKGAADASTAVGFRVYLGWTDPDGAVALAKAVSDPRSSSYGQYLTPNQFRARFAPSASATAKVQNWLRGQGLDITYTPQNNHYISVEGTLAQAQAAFGAQFGIYAVKGHLLRSPMSDLSIPSDLAATVKSVVGLDQSYQFVQSYRRLDTNAPPSAGFRNSPPLSAFWAELLSQYSFPTGFTDVALPKVPWAVKGHTPDQIKGAYGLSGSGLDGSGQTVAIIDAYASPTILRDVNQWSVNRGLPTMNPSQLVQVVAPGTYKRPDNPQQDPSGWYGEETLDVEAVHGMAPGAKIVYVGAPNNRQDLDAALNHVVDNHLAQIVTNSYGFSTTELLPPGFVKPVEDTLIQAVIEGIGVYFSSGDNGDESSTFGFPTTDWPASSPWVTAVGGTALGVDAANRRAIETGWGTSDYSCNSGTLVCTRTGWLYGAGGGVSAVFGVPFYQQGLGLTGRGVPDVAALADPQTGLLVGQTQTFPEGAHYDEYRIGGTSLASPIFAGIMALADQAAGHPHGFANPTFYANKSAFYDVTSVKTAVARRNYINGIDISAGTADKLRTFDDYSGSTSQSTHTGWDNVTGLGSPGATFLSAIGH